jgi:hypothetical protein
MNSRTTRNFRDACQEVVITTLRDDTEDEIPKFVVTALAVAAPSSD